MSGMFALIWSLVLSMGIAETPAEAAAGATIGKELLRHVRAKQTATIEARSLWTRRTVARRILFPRVQQRLRTCGRHQSAQMPEHDPAACGPATGTGAQGARRPAPAATPARAAIPTAHRSPPWLNRRCVAEGVLSTICQPRQARDKKRLALRAVFLADELAEPPIQPSRRAPWAGGK